MRMLSRHLPTPSMLTATPRSSRIARNSMLVNWLPWSELKIAGTPYRSIASCRHSLQNATSMVLLTFHASTLRLNKSMMATRYTMPLGRRIYEISVAQAWFTCCIFFPRNRYGYFLCCFPFPCLEVMGFGETPRIPRRFMILRTLFSVASLCPTAWSCLAIFWYPVAGWAVHQSRTASTKASSSSQDCIRSLWWSHQ